MVWGGAQPLLPVMTGGKAWGGRCPAASSWEDMRGGVDGEEALHVFPGEQVIKCGDAGTVRRPELEVFGGRRRVPAVLADAWLSQDGLLMVQDSLCGPTHSGEGVAIPFFAIT